MLASFNTAVIALAAFLGGVGSALSGMAAWKRRDRNGNGREK